MKLFVALAAGLLAGLALAPAAFGLTVESDFEGASVRVVQTDDATQTIRFMPGGDPARGWPCWWHFRVSGLSAEKTLTLELAGSDAPMPQANGQPSDKPLQPSWAMPGRASFSQDGGRTWRHTAPGRKQDGRMIYTVEPKETFVLVAWGPPYTPTRAAEFLGGTAAGSAAAKATELCRSRAGRSVPMLRVSEGNRAEGQRFGVWVQARQHAWESGSSWVAQGFAEWVVGADSEAAWLRQHAEIFIVPIMDIDNTATGNGGKEALPQDHNRDWSQKPNWNEVAAAQRTIGELAKQGRMDFFFDLHNPGPTDSQAFFYATAGEHLSEQARANQAAFVPIARAEIAPAMPMLEQPKPVGPSYHPLWRQTSFTWVHAHGNPQTVALCLETPWNTERSTVEGYKAVGASLAKAVKRYLAGRPPHGTR